METLASPAAISGGSSLEISPIRVNIREGRSFIGRQNSLLLLGKGNWNWSQDWPIYILSEIFVGEGFFFEIGGDKRGGKAADCAARTRKPAQREIKSAADRFSTFREAGFFSKKYQSSAQGDTRACM